MASDHGNETLTFDQSASKFIIETFGWDLNDKNVIVNDEGDWIPSYAGDKVHLSEFAGIVKGPEGDPTPLCENFAELADYVGDRRDE